MVLAIALILAAWPAPAPAQERAKQIRATVEALRAEEAKARPLVDRMRKLVAENEAKQKAYRAADAELKAIKPRLDRYNADLAKYEAALGAYSKDVTAYNKRCAGTLPREKYRACLDEKGALAAKKIEIDKSKAKLEAEREAVTKALKAKNAALAAIAKDMRANLTQWEAAAKDYRARFGRVDGFRKRLTEFCVLADKWLDIPSVRQCVSLGWDSKRKEFAALTDLPTPAQ